MKVASETRVVEVVTRLDEVIIEKLRGILAVLLLVDRAHVVLGWRLGAEAILLVVVIVMYNVPNEKVQHEHDINKCRTDCTLKNKLGPYERFDVSAQIEEYVKVNTLKNGIYYKTCTL